MSRSTVLIFFFFFTFYETLTSKPQGNEPSLDYNIVKLQINWSIWIRELSFDVEYHVYIYFFNKWVNWI